MRNAMAHFNFNQGLFQSKAEMSKYISDEGKEYIPYDYNFANDVVPAINNLLPDVEKVPLSRELKNVKVFLQGSLIGLCFKNFDFGDVQAAGALFGATSSPYISMLYFINCRFGVNDGLIFHQPVSVFMTVCLRRITMSAFAMTNLTPLLNLIIAFLTAV